MRRPRPSVAAPALRGAPAPAHPLHAGCQMCMNCSSRCPAPPLYSGSLVGLQRSPSTGQSKQQAASVRVAQGQRLKPHAAGHAGRARRPRRCSQTRRSQSAASACPHVTTAPPRAMRHRPYPSTPARAPSSDPSGSDVNPSSVIYDDEYLEWLARDPAQIQQEREEILERMLNEEEPTPSGPSLSLRLGYASSSKTSTSSTTSSSSDSGTSGSCSSSSSSDNDSSEDEGSGSDVRGAAAACCC